jgi:hypothetical protein
MIGSKTSPSTACSCRKRRAVFAYRSTVVAARFRSWTIHDRYRPNSADSGVTAACSFATGMAPASRK